MAINREQPRSGRKVSPAWHLFLRNSGHAAACTLAHDIQAETVTRLSRENCTIELSGPIEVGDKAKLDAVLKDQEGDRLCLNSAGGNYAEALKIIESLLQRWSSMPTVVDARAECLSARALIFLAGYEDLGHDLRVPSRFLHVEGKVGFHAPFIPATAPAGSDAAAQKTYQAGVHAIGRLLALSTKSASDKLFPTSLLTEALKIGPGAFFWIDTVDKAGRWDIGLLGMKDPVAVTEVMIAQACHNLGSWGRDESTGDATHDAKGRPVSFTRGLHQTLLPGFGAEGSYNCVANLYRSPDGKLFIELTLAATAAEVPDLKQFSSSIDQLKTDGKNRNFEVMGFQQNYHLLPANTKLIDLQKIK